jgi:hypothetical protein
MPSVEQPLECFALPQHADCDPRPELVGDPFEPPERQPVDATAFETSDERPRYACPRRKVLLAPATPDPQRTKRQPDPDAIHGHIVPDVTYRALTQRARSPARVPAAVRCDSRERLSR